MLTINPTKQYTDAVSAALAELEKFSGPEVEALKASAKQTIEAAVAASGPIAAQLLNLGLSSIPGVSIFAPAIEMIADPIVSGFVSNEAKAVANVIEGTPNPQPS